MNPNDANAVLAARAVGPRGGCPDYVGFDEVAADLGARAALRLARHADHVGLDGRPAWDRDRLADLAELSLKGGPRP